MRAAAALALACAACGPSAYACTDQNQCAIDQLAGVCQADGFCSFPDDDCPSGQRYGEYGGPLAGQCVPAAEETGSSSGMPSTSDTVASLDATSDPSSTIDPITTTASTSSSSDAGTTMGSTTEEPIESDPLLWFTFDDLGATGVTNLGSLGGAAACMDTTCPTPIEGVIGVGAQFDGVDDCAVFPYTPELAQIDALTLSAWLLRDPLGNDYDCVLCKPVGVDPWNTWRLATYDDVDGAAVADFRVGTADNTGVSLASPIPTATWTHVVGTWDGVTMAVWVDSVLVSESPNDSYEVDDQPVYLGCDDDHELIGITNFLTGSVDDVRLYGRVLGDEEIIDLFAQGM